MTLYLDSSALVKCYGEEAGALDTIELIDRADLVATSQLSRVEVVSALARAARRGLLSARAAAAASRAFAEESRSLVQVPATEPVLLRAQQLVWDAGLRGYDAVQLASALTWAERVGAAPTFATFDRRLGLAARGAGLVTWPPA